MDDTVMTVLIPEGQRGPGHACGLLGSRQQAEVRGHDASDELIAFIPWSQEISVPWTREYQRACVLSARASAWSYID